MAEDSHLILPVKSSYFNDMFKKIKADREEHAQEFDNHLYGLMNKNEKQNLKNHNNFLSKEMKS